MSHLLEVNGLTTAFTGDYGRTVSVDHVDFYVDEGEVVCIVGESGCGKSVTSLSIMGLLGRDDGILSVLCFAWECLYQGAGKKRRSWNLSQLR